MGRQLKGIKQCQRVATFLFRESNPLNSAKGDSKLCAPENQKAEKEFWPLVLFFSSSNVRIKEPEASLRGFYLTSRWISVFFTENLPIQLRSILQRAILLPYFRSSDPFCFSISLCLSFSPYYFKFRPLRETVVSDTFLVFWRTLSKLLLRINEFESSAGWSFFSDTPHKIFYLLKTFNVCHSLLDQKCQVHEFITRFCQYPFHFTEKYQEKNSFRTNGSRKFNRSFL